MDMKNLKQIAFKHKDLLSPPYNKIITMDGFDAICELSEHFYGEIHLIPSIRHIFSPCIKQEVLKQEVLETFKTHKLTELSRKYGYTARTLRSWIDTYKKTS